MVAKILLIFLAIIVVIIAAFSFVIGFFRRLLGLSPKKSMGFTPNFSTFFQQKQAGFQGFSPRTSAQPLEDAEVLYDDENTTVLSTEDEKNIKKENIEQSAPKNIHPPVIKDAQFRPTTPKKAD